MTNFTTTTPRQAPATFALIVIASVTFLAMELLDANAVIRLLRISAYYDYLAEIRGGEIWRLITPAFLHFSLFHIVFNLLWIWEFGRLIEARHGITGLLILFAIIGIIANLAQYFVSGPRFGGMSGVVYGFFGYLWIQGKFNPTFPYQLNPALVYLLLGFFVLCWSGILELLFDLRVANTAHTFGLLSGIAPAFLLIFIQRFFRK